MLKIHNNINSLLRQHALGKKNEHIRQSNEDNQQIKIYSRPLIEKNITLSIDNNIYHIRKQIFMNILLSYTIIAFCLSYICYMKSQIPEANETGNKLSSILYLVFTLLHVYVIQLVIVKPMLETNLEKNVDSEILKITNCFIPGFIVNLCISIFLQYASYETYKSIGEAIIILISIILSITVDLMFYRLFSKTGKKMYLFYVATMVLFGVTLSPYKIPGNIGIISF